jgi:hypothetical protein
MFRVSLATRMGMISKSCNTRHLEMLWKYFSLRLLFLCTLLHKLTSIFVGMFLPINPLRLVMHANTSCIKTLNVKTKPELQRRISVPLHLAVLLLLVARCS